MNKNVTYFVQKVQKLYLPPVFESPPPLFKRDDLLPAKVLYLQGVDQMGWEIQPTGCLYYHYHHHALSVSRYSV